MKLLLTGANGFVSKNFIDKKPDFIIHKFDRFNNNITNQISLVDSILHLAGKAHDTKNTSTPDEYYQANFELTKKLYDAFLASNAKKFIFMSSVKAAADSVDGSLTEDVIANPQTHYGKSKRLAEEYILSNLPSDKQVYILRPCMIHGPGNKGNLNLLYKIAKLGLPWPLASFENNRSFLSIDNLCFIINELLTREDIPSGIYHLSDDQAISTNRLIEIMSEELGNSKRLLKINKNLIKTIANIGDNLHLPLNSERLKKLTESYVVSNKKIMTAIAKPLPLDVENGLRKTIQSFKQNTN